MISHQQYKDQWLGKRDDFDGGAGFQCTDIARRYVATVYGEKSYPFYHNGDILKGGAIDAYYDFNHSLIRSSKVKLITYKPGLIPKQGDIIILGASTTNKYGHIAIVDSANANSFISIDQNWPNGSGTGQGTDAIGLKTHDYKRILGWITLIINEPIMSTYNVYSQTFMKDGSALTEVWETHDKEQRAVDSFNREKNNFFTGSKYKTCRCLKDGNVLNGMQGDFQNPNPDSGNINDASTDQMLKIILKRIS